ncbi:hypothetical protein PR048_024531 [Dryococelus australis]|uniref:Uncharacterized protein n=1 Tax=Dryococelus australis TaxID=614101 RepID=A0ABQ9GNW2_9NEOP|nr:hypothetical protein PR048_024531 [Dryococelus australis]
MGEDEEIWRPRDILYSIQQQMISKMVVGKREKRWLHGMTELEVPGGWRSRSKVNGNLKVIPDGGSKMSARSTAKCHVRSDLPNYTTELADGLFSTCSKTSFSNSGGSDCKYTRRQRGRGSAGTEINNPASRRCRLRAVLTPPPCRLSRPEAALNSARLQHPLPATTHAHIMSQPALLPSWTKLHATKTCHFTLWGPPWLAFSPSTKANRFQSPAGSLPDFDVWESCRTMALVGGFYRGSPVSHALFIRRCSVHQPPSSVLKTSLKNRPNLFTYTLA